MCISRRTLAALACAFVVCVGCQNTIFVASEGAYVDTKVYARGTPFRIATPNVFGFWGLVPGARIVHVDRLVSRALGRDVRIITGLRITQYVGLCGALTEIFTLGLLVPRTLVIEGAYHEQGLPTSPVP